MSCKGVRHRSVHRMVLRSVQGWGPVRRRRQHRTVRQGIDPCRSISIVSFRIRNTSWIDIKRILFTAAFLGALITFLTSPASALDTPSSVEQQAQQIIQNAPLTLEQFLADPGGTIYRAVVQALRTAWQNRAQNYHMILRYLLFGGLFSLALPQMRLRSTLDWVYTAGIILLTADASLHTITDFCSRVTGWKNYLIGFSPVYATVLTLGGHPALGSVYTGFFLSAVQLFAHFVETLLLPIVKCYLVISAAGILSSSGEIRSLCLAAGTLVQKAVRYAGAVFVGIVGLQRALGAGADSAAFRAGSSLISAIPIIGQTLSGASGTVLSAFSLLRTGIGFAAISVISAEFLPLFLDILVQLLLLHLFALLGRLFGLDKSSDLINCTILVFEAINALAVVFFLIIVVTTALMITL